MRIAVVHSLPPGGAARRVGSTVSGWLDDPVHELREFTLGDSLDFLSDIVRIDWRPTASERPAALRSVWRYIDLLRSQAAWARLWAAVDDWAPEAVFVNPCSYPGGAPPALARLRSPSVYYCDEPRRIDYEPGARLTTRARTRWLYWPMRRMQRSAERASVGAATVLVTNSTYSAANIEDAYGRSSVVVRPAIDETFAAGQPAVRTHVLSVGTLIPSKGHDLVLRAVAKSGCGLPVLVVAPRPDPIYQRELEDLAAGLGVTLDVRVGISDRELVTCYRQAWVTMYLAQGEPLGLVSLESQACLTPVIVSAEGGLPETITGSALGVAVPLTVDAAAAALLATLDRTDQERDVGPVTAVGIPRGRDVSAEVYRLLASVVELDRV